MSPVERSRRIRLQSGNVLGSVQRMELPEFIRPILNAAASRSGPISFLTTCKRSRLVTEGELVSPFDCVKKGVTRSLSLTGSALIGLSALLYGALEFSSRWEQTKTPGEKN